MCEVCKLWFACKRKTMHLMTFDHSTDNTSVWNWLSYMYGYSCVGETDVGCGRLNAVFGSFEVYSLHLFVNMQWSVNLRPLLWIRTNAKPFCASNCHVFNKKIKTKIFVPKSSGSNNGLVYEANPVLLHIWFSVKT